MRSENLNRHPVRAALVSIIERGLQSIPTLSKRSSGQFRVIWDSFDTGFTRKSWSERR